MAKKTAKKTKPTKAQEADANKTGTKGAATRDARSKDAKRKPAKHKGGSAVEREPAVAASGASPALEPRPIALDLPMAELDPETRAYFDKCIEKIGFVPNVLLAYAFDLPKFKAFSAMYNDLMLAPSGLSKIDREMIAVAVSAVNRCFYCLTAHGAAVRQLSGDPVLGELMVMNYRAADLDPRRRAMLDFAVKLTEAPQAVDETDRAALRTAGFSDRDIWDIAAVTGFFNMSNRVATATDMRPNAQYHAQAR